MSITVETIESLFPDSCKWLPESQWDAVKGRLISDEVRRLGSVELARRPAARPDPGVTTAALLQAVRQRGYLCWSGEDLQLLGRLRLLHNTVGAPWPDVSEELLLRNMDTWLAPHLNTIQRLDQLDQLPLGEYVRHSLDWKLQQEMDKLAPSHLEVPSGSRLKIDYSGGEPVLAVKLQEMFGQTESPKIINQRVPVVIHLLSPARRPVQVTRDLANFWASTYFEVRKDLRGRYPRHPWPDDPLVAQATRHTKNRK